MRPTTMSLACVLALSACDRGEPTPTPQAAPDATAPTAPPTPTTAPPTTATTAAPQTAETTAAPPTAETTAATPVVTTPVDPSPTAKAPTPDETFDALVARLTVGLPVVADPAATAFVHLRANDLAAAQPLFALAAKQEPAPWKHPFNLACAAARAGDEAVARVALREAVRRDPARVAAKARTDADLASVRGREWFEPVLRGEPPPAPVPAEAPLAEAPPAEAPPPAAPPTDPPPATPPVEPPQPPVPQVAPAGDFPRGVTKALGKPELALLNTKLAEFHRAKAKVRGTLVHPDKAGVLVGFAVYEVSRYDACLGATPDPKAKENKRACRQKYYGNVEEGEPNDMLCNNQYIVRLSSLAPVAIGKPEDITKSCTMKVQRLAAHDFDADGQDEVLLDAIGVTTFPAYRTGGEENFLRRFKVLRLDGTTQLGVDVEWQITEFSNGMGTAMRFGLRDDDGEGHPDMIVSSREFELDESLDLPDILWPTPEDDPSAEFGPIKTERWPYDAASDTWLQPPGKR